jgi:predicted AAA+ superfamily ATPase
MQVIEASEIIGRIRIENPWWAGESQIRQSHRAMKPRAYFELFLPLVKSPELKRAIVLMGPRRVGKTVMIHHTIQALLDEGVLPPRLCYFSVDHPIYNGLRLDQFLDYYRAASGTDYRTGTVYLFFDEIQYLRKWEVHLKSLVDTHPNLKVVASGSAAAALRIKSTESGAGRMTDFLLPPLNFYEFLSLLNKTDLVKDEGGAFVARDIDALNEQFLAYLNFGGYPEVILSKAIQADPSRFIKSDIIDKVLLRDIPSLYGIDDIQELNYLFTTLAFNTAHEISLGELSQNSSVAKNTIKKYIEYLEAAFLIKIVHRVDHTAKRFRRANFFKVYLTNPSMRAALFSPVQADDNALPSLVETAVFSQWFHSVDTLHYARWPDGEVDIVMLDPQQKAMWAVEVKWSDQYAVSPGKLKSLIDFCQSNNLIDALVTSRTKDLIRELDGLTLEFKPASVYCYTVGYNLVQGKISFPNAQRAHNSAKKRWSRA